MCFIRVVSLGWSIGEWMLYLNTFAIVVWMVRHTPALKGMHFLYTSIRSSVLHSNLLRTVAESTLHIWLLLFVLVIYRLHVLLSLSVILLEVRKPDCLVLINILHIGSSDHLLSDHLKAPWYGLFFSLFAFFIASYCL